MGTLWRQFRPKLRMIWRRAYFEAKFYSESILRGRRSDDLATNWRQLFSACIKPICFCRLYSLRSPAAQQYIKNRLSAAHSSQSALRFSLKKFFISARAKLTLKTKSKPRSNQTGIDFHRAQVFACVNSNQIIARRKIRDKKKVDSPLKIWFYAVHIVCRVTRPVVMVDTRRSMQSKRSKTPCY